MYETQGFREILDRMLARVPDTIDKREGSIIYDALAPAAMELAQMYAELDVLLRLTFADTASGEYLTRRAKEIGVTRKPATPARRIGLMYDKDGVLMDIPIGSRFRAGDLIFVAQSRIGTGQYELVCETAGAVGNEPSGELLPVDYISGLATAVFGDFLERGADEEDDENLRRRYFDSLRGHAFGGNIADYKQKVLAIEGVTAVKVYPVWNGPGTVRLIILGTGYLPADAGLVARVQELVDPPPQGQGYGIAPIGHTVTVNGAAPVTIDVATTLVLDTGYTPDSVRSDIIAKIDAYFTELRQSWQDTAGLVVRTAIITARLLDVPGVLDVTTVALNGISANITLADDAVPVLGAVTINV